MPPYPASTAVAPKKARGGRMVFAASVVAASLLVGGGAGFGGAAAYHSWQGDDGGTSTPSAATKTSDVVDTPSTPGQDGSVQQVASEVLPSVVKIDVKGSQEEGSGSGIILSSDGTILTNNHVVEVAGQNGSIVVDFNDGSSAPAKIVGTDPLTDTAVIKAQGVSGLTPATIGKSSSLAVGQGVVAIGSPFGLDATVTSGIVSALDRPVDVGRDSSDNVTAYPAIQTDAAINPGNSGGPLVNLSGQVVGINASIQTTGSDSSSPFGQTQESGSIGLGFAIPMDEVMPVVAQMIKGETPTHARLGISVSDNTAASGDNADTTEGALVQDVSSDSTASKAGLSKGDLITKVDDHIITGADSLVATIRSYRPGDKVTVTYLQDGDTKTADLVLDSDEEVSNS
ncbi:trypsin-like peptidase domain-containing protein [Nocardioides sp. CBS4Y-1]|uniref:Trypsin-like peptidase domain-containing protein n=2 Tax=Nocardioides acrostichi TaxID=2784339 RepID=A0A930Y8B3_9ACTN|nr:trypsin-like peptidase domain-containing protein [Nocardioides acrostichi]